MMSSLTFHLVTLNPVFFIWSNVKTSCWSPLSYGKVFVHSLMSSRQIKLRQPTISHAPVQNSYPGEAGEGVWSGEHSPHCWSHTNCAKSSTVRPFAFILTNLFKQRHQFSHNKMSCNKHAYQYLYTSINWVAVTLYFKHTPTKMELNFW